MGPRLILLSQKYGRKSRDTVPLNCFYHSDILKTRLSELPKEENKIVSILKKVGFCVEFFFIINYASLYFIHFGFDVWIIQ